MANYKSVRLEEQVYNDLAERQLPRESISQTLERLLKNLDGVTGAVYRIVESLGGDITWNSKR